MNVTAGWQPVSPSKRGPPNYQFACPAAGFDQMWAPSWFHKQKYSPAPTRPLRGPDILKITPQEMHHFVQKVAGQMRPPGRSLDPSSRDETSAYPCPCPGNTIPRALLHACTKSGSPRGSTSGDIASPPATGAQSKKNPEGRRQKMDSFVRKKAPQMRHPEGALNAP